MNIAGKSILVVVLWGLVGSLSGTFASTLHVDDDAPPGGDGTSWNTAFKDLQDALDQAKPGDEIRVGRGVYRPSKRIDVDDRRSATFAMMNGVALLGGFAGYGHANPDERDIEHYVTRISGDLKGDDGPRFTQRQDNAYHIFYHPDGLGLDDTAVLDGFTLSGGHANGAYPHNTGGGMQNYRSAPRIRRCRITDNFASFIAGGIYVHDASSIITECRFDGNACFGGAGLHVIMSFSTVTHCDFIANHGPGLLSANNGGLSIEGCSFRDNLDSGVVLVNKDASVIRDCLFRGNRDCNNGGGIISFDDCKPVIERCAFIDNVSALRGGGIYDKGGDLKITSCLFRGNVSGEGGGVSVSGSYNLVMDNCLFHENSASIGGGGLFFGSAMFYSLFLNMTNCTFTGNSAPSGGAIIGNITSTMTIEVTNSVIWNNTVDEIYVGGTGTGFSVTHSLVKGGWPGVGNQDGDPLFVDAAKGDLHLRHDSPCRDSGDAAATYLPEKDFEGDPRIAGSVPDQGADEFHTHLYCTGDAVPGKALYLNFVDPPGTGPVILWVGSGLLDPPLQISGHGSWFLELPVILEKRLGSIPGPEGVFTLTVGIPRDVPAPLEFHIQALHQDHLTNPLVIRVD